MKRTPENGYPAKYDRRAKVAAVLTGLSLFGGAVEAGISAPSASAKPEAAAREAMSPQEYLTKVEKRILKLQKELLANPRVHHARTSPNLISYIVRGPSVKNTSHHDKFAMGYYKTKKYPAFTELLVDAEANPGAKIENPPGALYMIEQLNPATKKIDRNFVTLTVTKPGGTKVYSVSNNADPAARLVNSDGSTTYSSHPGAVAKQFDTMLNDAERILKHTD